MENLDVVVSLTTWKNRINEPTLPKILYVLLNQNTQYNYKVVLVLSREEFGDNYQVPEILDLLQEHQRFEILWTYKNTKALKKLNTTMEKYPDVPIITLDDDILVEKDTVEKMMKEHKQTPNYILGNICGVYNGIMRVAYIRLFPPHSLADIPDDYFIEYFGAFHDDEWNGIRAKLKKTPMRKLNCKISLNASYGSQKCCFRNSYRKFNFRLAYNKFIKEHPEYKS